MAPLFFRVKYYYKRPSMKESGINFRGERRRVLFQTCVVVSHNRHTINAVLISFLLGLDLPIYLTKK